MANTIQFVKKEKAWQARYDPLAPKAGDLALDFELLDTNGENRLRLSDFRGRKPVALVFGRRSKKMVGKTICTQVRYG